jgi:hypothetical protein
MMVLHQTKIRHRLYQGRIQVLDGMNCNVFYVSFLVNTGQRRGRVGAGVWDTLSWNVNLCDNVRETHSIEGALWKPVHISHLNP